LAFCQHAPVPLRVPRAAGVAVALTLLAAAPASAVPIDDPSPTGLPLFSGAAAVAQPVAPTIAPNNPFMARNPASNLHNDPWMTDAYPDRSGPLGNDLQATSGAMPLGLCGSLTFDSHGRIVSVCPSFVNPVTARVIDPETFEVLATYAMPGGPNQPGPGAYQNFTGGGYFFLDRRDRIWSAVKTSHLVVLAQRDGGRKLVKVGDYDLTSVLRSDERVTSALPDFRGNVWFVSKQGGVVGVLNPRTGKIRSVRLGEEIENSFAMGRDGAYIVSDKRMYRFDLRRGRPHVVWSVTYANSGIVKPSQLNAGSGTTPTIMPGGYVAITDNADPMNVVVYRTAAKLGRGVDRTVCAVPVFGAGASATENSIISAGRSLFVENNYGYQDPFGDAAGSLTTPGFARVDLRADGSGCDLVWTNSDVRAPTVVPKLSDRTGLIYSYEQSAPNTWFWVAIDARTGETKWRRYAGSGLGFNNNYAGIALAQDGTAYLGVIGGLVRLRDG
jgi:hypothetical protein